MSKAAMTLMELLIVVSLIAMLSLALYQSLANGLKVWAKSREMLLEEDIVLFFDRLSRDLVNAFPFSKINLEGGEERLSFPTIVSFVEETQGPSGEARQVDQIGRVEYSFDLLTRSIMRRQSNYGQTLQAAWGEPRALVRSVDRLQFKYIYVINDGEITQNSIVDKLPESLEVEVEFSDTYGRRTMKKIIDLPLGG